MQSIIVLFLTVLLCHTFISVSAQGVQGRYLRPNQPKCNRHSGCPARDDYADEAYDGDYKPSDDKLRPEDDYRSIAGGGGSNIDKHFKPAVGGDTEDYEHKIIRDEPSHRPTSGSGYNRKPIRDSTDYIPKLEDDPPPIHNPKDEIYNPPTGGGGYNRKPVRGSNGGYNPRPVSDIDHDAYNPKPVGAGNGGYNPEPVGAGNVGHNPKPVGTGNGGYNPKPVGTGNGGYNPQPEPDRDGYVSRPVVDDHRPVSPVARDDYVPRPVSGGGGYRPKPSVNRDAHRPRPVTDGDYHKPGDLNLPIGPSYPNKDIGGYEDPKDDDYNDDIGTGGGIKDGDFVGDVKPVPVVEGGNCICVPYYQCQEGHIVTDGAGIIDARKRPEPDEELPLDGKFKPPSCGPFHVCCNTPETSTVKPYEHRCGVRNPSGINSRLLSPSNKGEADFGEWPWQAAVLKAEGKVNIFQCGGVLIDKFHVLTVAHCVFHLYKYNEYPLKVRLGEWDTQTTTEFLAHEDYKVSKIIVHPEYRNTSLWNDVAILRLEEAVLFAPHIDTICLPKYDEIFAEQNCVVTGWGKDAYKGGTFSNIMKEVALQVIDNYKCEEMLRKTRLGRFFQLHEGFLCAGGEFGLDSCKGDGGGPLVCYRKDKSYALAGIVSWGIDCGQPGVPGVYVKIQKYLDWISKSTGMNLQDYWPK